MVQIVDKIMSLDELHDKFPKKWYSYSEVEQGVGDSYRILVHSIGDFDDGVEMINLFLKAYPGRVHGIFYTCPELLH